MFSNSIRKKICDLKHELKRQKSIKENLTWQLEHKNRKIKYLETALEDLPLHKSYIPEVEKVSPNLA